MGIDINKIVNISDSSTTFEDMTNWDLLWSGNIYYGDIELSNSTTNYKFFVFEFLTETNAIQTSALCCANVGVAFSGTISRSYIENSHYCIALTPIYITKVNTTHLYLHASYCLKLENSVNTINYKSRRLFAKSIRL